jgi:CheY-like chemotaxis protein
VLELACFVAGALAACAVLLPWLRRRARADAAGLAAAAAAPPPDAPPQPRPLPRPLVPADARRLAVSLAEQLANLGSCVEVRAHHLIEAAPDRALLPQAAETLLTAVKRLRTLHTKLVAFGHVHRPPDGEQATELPPLMAKLRGELQLLQLGLELRWEPRDDLPAVAVPTDVAHDALLFLCGAMLRAERGATHLSIASEPCFAHADPAVQLELALEWIAESPTPTMPPLADPAFTLDLEAANQLIVTHGGDLTLTHLPGRSVCAVVRWPIAPRPQLAEALGPAPSPAPELLPAALDAPPEPDTAAAAATPSLLPAELAASVAGGTAGDDTAPPHRYGGALVLESDPSVRAMLASELKATGRAVFACADGASARTFLEATPDRFELLIVDHAQRLDGNDALAATIREVAPDLKIFVLAAGRQPPSGEWSRVHHIEKPFGVHELRRALASILAAG